MENADYKITINNKQNFLRICNLDYTWGNFFRIIFVVFKRTNIKIKTKYLFEPKKLVWLKWRKDRWF
jgi:hypothetical protein